MTDAMEVDVGSGSSGGESSSRRPSPPHEDFEGDDHHALHMDEAGLHAAASSSPANPDVESQEGKHAG